MAEPVPLTVEQATEMLADFGLTAEKVAALQSLAQAPDGDRGPLRTIWYRIESHTAVSEDYGLAELE